MKILITGADSFLGKNLKAELKNRKHNDILEITNYDNFELLNQYINQIDFIFHLQTLYRSNDPSDFHSVNVELTKKIVDIVGEKNIPILLLSSTQSGNSTIYGNSKKMAEECVIEWKNNTGNKAYIFRLANEFGKWCPPDLNSVVATFCYNIANKKEVIINDEKAPLKLMYIDDIINTFILALENRLEDVFCQVTPIYETTVGNIANMIQSFQLMRLKGDVVDMSNELIKKLYSTYLSYLPINEFSVPLVTHLDERGSFTELLHFAGMGQVSVNISKPGITKGNHWHQTKNEKFIVISGDGIIRFKKIGEPKIIEYYISGKNMEIIDIPSGYIHNITNTGADDLITIMWANEIFDNNKPDTYFEEVIYE